MTSLPITRTWGKKHYVRKYRTYDVTFHNLNLGKKNSHEKKKKKTGTRVARSTQEHLDILLLLPHDHPDQLPEYSGNQLPPLTQQPTCIEPLQHPLK